MEIGGTVLTYEVCSVGFCDVEETSLPIYCNLEDEAFRYLIEDANARNQVDGLEQLSAGDQNFNTGYLYRKRNRAIWLL